MYNSKKEVDNHVRIALSKIRTEKDRALRGLTIAKLYFKVKEYATAEQYICSYLGVRDDNEQAHKMLGQCYQFLKQPKKALQSFQRSLQLNPKQPELLAEVCQLLVDDDQMSANKAKYWCELAESARVENESVYALRMKLMNQSNATSSEIEAILRKEISNRPNDVNLRVRLLRHFLDQQQIIDAFKYVLEFELQQNEAFSNSYEYYNVLWLVLSKYEELPDTKKNWEFWLLAAMCLERLVFLSFIHYEPSCGSAVTETANWLFRMDQYLLKISHMSGKFQTQRELVALFLEHYRSQLIFHAVALIFKRELLQKKNKWRETLHLSLPLLLLAYHAEPKGNKEPWMKHCDENGAKLIQLWYREGSFRCAQAGRILLSCISEDNKENSKHEINSVFGTQVAGLWSSTDELLAQVRQICVDKQWRRNVFAQLFCNSDQKLKEQTSLLVKNSALAEPIYELPTVSTIEGYEEAAQHLKPHSLRHMVYLHLTYGDLSQVKAKFFDGFNFSTSNLSFCGGESLNQLDMDSYLYAAIIETQRNLQIKRELSECYSSQGNKRYICRPRILPYVNMHSDLCNDEQLSWWLLAYKLYKNLIKSDNVAQMRADLQTGIEVIRGINGPKMDMMIVFKLGKIFSFRAKNVEKPVERSFLEARAENLYLHGLKMLKLHNRGVLEPFRKTFRYKENAASERELNEIAELAVLYLSERMMKKQQYEDLIEEMSGVPLPFAAYKQAEAYRKMEAASNTSKSAKQRYSERAAECLQQTLALLKNTKFDTNHPLNATIHTELKRLQKNAKKFNNENADEYDLTPSSGGGGHNNSSTYEDAQTEFFSPTTLNRSTRNVVATLLAAANATPPPSTAATQNSEIEALVKQMVSTLTLVKEELVCTIKPEVFSMRQEIISLKDKVSQLEDSMKKMRTSSTPPSRDDGSNVLDDLYIIEDALQNQLYPQQQQQQQTTQMFPNATGNNNTANTSTFSGQNQPLSNQLLSNQLLSNQLLNNPPQSNQQRMNTPSSTLQMQQQAAAAAVAAYNSPIFNPNYPLNYYTSPYMLAQQNAAASNSLLAQRGQLGLPYMEHGSNMNFNMPPTASLFPSGPTTGPQVPQPHALTDGRTNNMFSLINSTPPNPPPPLQLPHPTLPPNMSLPSLSAMPMGQSITTSSPLMPNAPTTITFNKALNNQPVEKGPPANVVITSSDPLPNPRNAIQLQQQQPTLSVTIPSHHIKPSLVQTPEVISSLGAFNTQPQPVMPPTAQGNVFGNNSFGGGMGSNSSFTFGNTTNTFPGTKDATSNFINNFSFKPAVEQALAANNSASSANDNDKSSSNKLLPLNESTLNEFNKSLDAENAEYDPRPDFQPIIPLPDEIEVRTGEEDEEVVFCEHAKLYRYVDKEWKERGVGTLKILKSKDQHSRILMRRDQTHKICANHKITKDLKLTPKVDKNGHNWAAPDFADGEMRSEIFYVRFKTSELAQKFYDAFVQAQKDDETLKAQQEKANNKKEVTAQPPFGLAKSSITSFATSTPTGTPTTKADTKLSSSSAVSKENTEKPKVVNNTVNKPLFGALNSASNASSITTTTVSTTAPNPFANFTFSTISSTTATTPQVSSGLTTMTSIAPTPFGANLFGKLTETTTTPFSVANLNLPTLGTSQSTANGTQVKVSDAPTTTATTNLNKSNASDNEDDYVPTAQFKPVIPLPELVEVSTGEENYKQLFEHRAKLLRYDKETKEWKERGIGNIRILQHKNDKDDVRLVMRREQIHKLCCNQRIYKDIDFKYAKNSQTALQWIGHDYSDGELITESLTLRFKTQEVCKEFYETLLKAQAEMSDKAIMQAGNAAESDSTTTKTNKQISATTATTASATTTETKGFGDAFKPKVGSWTCTGCYIINPADKLHCLSCETPKDDTVPKKEATKTSFAANPNISFNFGFSNATQTNTATKQATTDGNVGFKFPTYTTTTTTTAATTSTNTTNTTNSFGDKFKPKPGSWNCSDCYTNNTADKVYCASCEAPQNSSIPKKETANTATNKNILALSDPTQKFSFGFPTAPVSQPISTVAQPGFPNATQTNTSTKQTTIAVTTDGNVGFKFSNYTTTTPAAATTTSTTNTTNNFGDKFKPKPGSWNCSDCYTNNDADKVYCASCEAPQNSSIPKKETSNTATNKNILALSDPTQKFSFGFPTAPVNQPISTVAQPAFGTSAVNTLPTLEKSSFTFNLQSKAITSPAMPTDSALAFPGPFSLNKKEFNFTMSSKSSETESPKIGGGDTETTDPDDSSHFHEEEENNTYFAPVIPLPDKIDVKTGEEDEDILYQHRAKLYRYADSEWKERGIGDVKILRHKTTNKLRVVMRRDQIYKICLNHALNESVDYKPKDDKSWLFVVNDYSEGEVNLEKFSLRFKTKEIAEDFMNAIKSALNKTAAAAAAAAVVESADLNGHHLNEKTGNQTKFTSTQKTEIAEKKSTENNDKDEPKWPLIQPDLKLPPNSIPTALSNRSFSLKQSALQPSKQAAEEKPSNDSNQSAAINFSFKAAFKENEDAKVKAPVSGGFLFGSGDVGTGVNKFGSSSIFGGGIANKPLFGQTTSIFETSTKPKDHPSQSGDANETTKFIFGEKLGNVATPSTASIFGAGLANNPKPMLFGGNTTEIGSKTGTQQSIFSGNNTNNTTAGSSLFGGAATFANANTALSNKNGSIFGGIGSTISDQTNNNANTTTKTFDFADLTAKTGGLDFASLAAAAAPNNNESSAKLTLKPGPGRFVGLTNQDAFSSFLKTDNKNANKEHMNSNNAVEDDAGDGDDDAGNDENYDPHYEPIIPLPKEIVVSTGEEDEEKLFSERAVLFRQDPENKEWKERGVGEIKILKHSTSGRFRLLLRREQVHKLVLNFPITESFKFNTMKNNPKSFIFIGMNYAESTEGAYEMLAVRFKKQEIATEFSNCLNGCLDEVQNDYDAE